MPTLPQGSHRVLLEKWTLVEKDGRTQVYFTWGQKLIFLQIFPIKLRHEAPKPEGVPLNVINIFALGVGLCIL